MSGRILLSAASRGALWRARPSATAAILSEDLVRSQRWPQLPQPRTLVFKASGKPEHIVAERERIASLGHWERKKALKEKRRLVYQQQQERKERVKVRRAGRPMRGMMRQEFRRFFIRKKVDEEYMHRKARQAGLEWDYRISVIVKRGNVVLPDLEPWERAYQDLRDHLDQYGKRYPEELVGKRNIEDYTPMTEEELLAALPFTPAPRETEADHSGEVRTTDRCLKDNVYLLVQQREEQKGSGDSDSSNNNNSSSKWQFPTVALRYPDETCLEAARRAVAELAGDELRVWCPSGCPWSVELTAYPPERQQSTGRYGLKNFFMLVQYDEGRVVDGSDNGRLQDFAWLDRGEIVERIREQNGERQSRFYHYML